MPNNTEFENDLHQTERKLFSFLLLLTLQSQGPAVALLLAAVQFSRKGSNSVQRQGKALVFLI